MNFFEQTLQNTFQKLGILIRYYSPSSSEEARRIKLIEHYKIDTILDVGANTGQYAQLLFNAGFKGEIISFEPQSKAYQALENNVKKWKNWQLAPKCAIGNESKEIEINIAENSVSSTVLEMLDSHYEGESKSKIISVETVRLKRLDEVAIPLISSENILLKIDVQGFEYPVLEGAEKLMNKIKGIELEISSEALYKGQTWLLPEVLNSMKEKGFALHSLTPAFTNKTTGKVLQYNGIFFKIGL